VSGANLDQAAHIRAVFHRFRACKPEHRDRYHAECPDCILIETNADRCEDVSHVHDGGGVCLTCGLFDARIAEADDSRLLHFIRRLKG
jgi:hypothetical protein